MENRLGAAIVGSDATVQVGLEKLVNDTYADEVIVVTDTYEHSERRDSYRRVARIAAEIKQFPNVEGDSNERFASSSLFRYRQLPGLTCITQGLCRSLNPRHLSI